MGVLARCRGAGCLSPLLLAWISLGAAPPAEPPLAAEHSEYEIESAMLYNFTKFVDWPEKALGESGVSAVIGVWGDDGLVPVLTAALGNKTVYGHPIVVRRLVSSAEVKSCTVLFVGASDRKEVLRIVQAAGNLPILTIGGIVQFSRLGGVIAFIREGNRIRFEINLDAADRAGLQVSSKLLRLAVVWRENPPHVRN
jgi:YfiR/HmsC-like